MRTGLFAENEEKPSEARPPGHPVGPQPAFDPHPAFQDFDNISQCARSLLRFLPKDHKARVYAARVLTAAENARRGLIDEITAQDRPRRGKK